MKIKLRKTLDLLGGDLEFKNLYLRELKKSEEASEIYDSLEKVKVNSKGEVEELSEEELNEKFLDSCLLLPSEIFSIISKTLSNYCKLKDTVSYPTGFNPLIVGKKLQELSSVKIDETQAYIFIDPEVRIYFKELLTRELIKYLFPDNFYSTLIELLTFSDDVDITNQTILTLKFLKLDPTLDRSELSLKLATFLMNSKEFLQSVQDATRDSVISSICDSLTNKISIYNLLKLGYNFNKEENKEKVLNDYLDKYATAKIDKFSSLKLESESLNPSDIESVKSLTQKQESQISVVPSSIGLYNESTPYGGYVKGELICVVAPPKCLTGDTNIHITGIEKTVTIEELYKKSKKELSDIGVFSNSKNSIVVNRIPEVRITDYVDELIEFEIDNKYKIRCTPDHLWLMKDNTYKKAREFKKYDSLKPFSRSFNTPEREAKAKGYNHQITSVEVLKLETPVPVYDLINVGNDHNFAVALSKDSNEGIFSHNCGKSAFLVQETANATKVGKKVLHCCLGDMTNFDLITRYLAALNGDPTTGSSKFVTGDNTISYFIKGHLVDEIQKPQYEEPLKNVKFVSLAMCSKDIFELMLYFKKIKTTFDFDLLVVDYDLNIKRTNNDSLYDNGGIIYEQLKKGAKDLNCAVLVATQPKNMYWQDEILSAESLSESSRKQHTIDSMICINRNEKCKTIGTINIAYMRRGEIPRPFRVYFDYAHSTLIPINESDYNHRLKTTKRLEEVGSEDDLDL